MYNENKPKINDDEVVNARRQAIEHRAMWMALILDEVRKAGGDWETIGRKAITRCGEFQAQDKFKKIMKDPDDVKEWGILFGSETKTFENINFSSCSDCVHTEMTYCPLLSGWRKLGFSEEDCQKFCDIAMDGDRAFAEAMGCEFILGSKIALGDDVCSLTFKKKN